MYSDSFSINFSVAYTYLDSSNILLRFYFLSIINYYKTLSLLLLLIVSTEYYVYIHILLNKTEKKNISL